MLTRLRSHPGRHQEILAAAGILSLAILFGFLRHLRDLSLHVIAAIAACLAAGIVYLAVLYFFERTSDSRRALWLILAGGVLFRLTLLPLAPTLSEDLYRYQWDGRIQSAGWNPYAVKPDDPRLTTLHEKGEKHFPGHDIPTIYPPLAELTFRLAYRFLPNPVAFKLPFFAADLLAMFLVAAWLCAENGRNFQVAIYAWNPLVIVEFAGSGHSDALAVAALVAAFVIIRSRPMLSTLLMAAAALFKLFPILLFPLWLRRLGWPRERRAWGAGLAAAALAAACAWPYRSALGQMPATLAYYQSRWQNNNASLYALLKMFTGSQELAAGLGIGVVVGLAFWTAARRIELKYAAYLIFGAALLLTPNAYPWYFTWIIPLLCFFPHPAWLLLTVLEFLSYQVLLNYRILGVWHFRPDMVLLTYLPFYALLAWRAIRPASRRSESRPGL